MDIEYTHSIVIKTTKDLVKIKDIGLHQRYGNWGVVFKGYHIYCRDLLALYTALKDIFVQEIYTIDAETLTPRIIDGGGHIGIFTLYAKEKYPDARITVFEPDEMHRILLEKNLNCNGIKDVEIIPAGLYDKEGFVEFASQKNDGSKICTSNTSNANNLIQVVRLSSYLVEPIDFLKLNIEGAEIAVITEAEDYLHNIKSLAIEYHGFPENGQSLHQILAILDRLGFRYLIHDFDRETNPATKPPFSLTQNTRFYLLIYAKRFNNVQPNNNKKMLFPKPDTRLKPHSRKFGLDYGLSICRYYIECFLEKNRESIKGRVLEVGDNHYTVKYGTGVTHSDVLHAYPVSGATIVGDLATGHNIPQNAFDCIILTQTIQCIYDVKAAIRNAIFALKPGGTLLLTASGISQISRYDMDRWGEFWRFTDASLRKLIAEYVNEEYVQVETFGNVATAKAYLDGIPAEALTNEVLDYYDPDYQCVIAARVIKPFSKQPFIKISQRKYEALSTPLILLYHRITVDPIDARLLNVAPQNFESHLDVLSRYCKVISLNKLISDLMQNHLEPHTVAITFDDGYLDNLHWAAPILAQHGMPATVFVCSGILSNLHWFWGDVVEYIFFSIPCLPNQLSITSNCKTYTWDLSTPAGRLAAYNELRALLRNESFEEIERFIFSLCEWANVTPEFGITYPVLNADQLSILASYPEIEIGSHGCSHVRLGVLPVDIQRQEIFNSKQELETFLNRSVRFFSYPYGSVGDFIDDTKTLVKESGYMAGIANIQNPVRCPVDIFSIPRLVVRDWDADAFETWLLKKNKWEIEKKTVELKQKQLIEHLENLKSK